MYRRDDGDTEINAAALDPHPKTSVLWDATFGNIQLRHDFDTGNDRLMVLDINGFARFIQRPVNTITHQHIGIAGFDVNIRSAFFKRSENDGVYQPNDRRHLRIARQPFQVYNFFADELFGIEESSEILPAIQTCRDQDDIDVSGPYSADTIFLRAASGEFDLVLSCYHDQGMIPVKCLSFGEAINVTLGLPFIRTSVDHGTAFDIAGKGIADASSMISAIKLAGELVNGSQNKVKV